MTFDDVVGAITDIEVIAVNASIRDLAILNEKYGQGRWRKLKGVARVKLEGGHICRAELHWYEAHGIGKRKLKIKRLLD